jgi:hypothetical protein
MSRNFRTYSGLSTSQIGYLRPDYSELNARGCLKFHGGRIVKEIIAFVRKKLQICRYLPTIAQLVVKLTFCFSFERLGVLEGQLSTALSTASVECATRVSI